MAIRCPSGGSVVASVNSSWLKSRKVGFSRPTCSKSLPPLSFFFFFSNVSYRLKCSSTCPSSINCSGIDELQIMRVRLLEDSLEQSCSEPAEGNVNESIRGALLDPRTEELGYRFYQKVKEKQDFTPERSMLRLLLRYLTRSKKWDLIVAVCNDFRKYNVLPDAPTCSRLVANCIKARKFRVVESLLEIFKSDSRIAVPAFHSAMKGYNKLHMYRSTLSLYEKMKTEGIGMDYNCYLQIMTAYHKIGDAERVVLLFDEFSSRKLGSDKATLSKMYRILCESLVKSGRAFEALEYFRDMKKKGILEDPLMYSSLVCSFAAIGQVQIAEEVFREAEERNMLSKDPEMFLKLVAMYVEEKQVEKTLDIVKAMKHAKLRVSDFIFCAIVNGFSRRKGFSAGVSVYKELVSQGCEPGQVTYASVINAYIQIGLYSEAEAVFLEMEQKGFDRCVVAYCSMISMYGKTGKIREAMRLVARMKQKGCRPNIWVYNSLLDMHGKAKDLRQVEKLWKEIKRRKIEPDKVTYTVVIGAYQKAMDFKACVEFYHEYRNKGGEIDRAMAGIMVGVFSKTNQVDELLKLLRDMKSEGTPLDGRLCRSALNALRDAGLDKHAVWLQHNFEAM